MSRMSEIDTTAQLTRMTRRNAIADLAERISAHDPEMAAIHAYAAATLLVRAVTALGVSPQAMASALAEFVAAWPAGGIEVR